ncbi:MAG: circularly permuted type 2 ATP-grasp protein [Acidimicrobiales bacterium]
MTTTATAEPVGNDGQHPGTVLPDGYATLPGRPDELVAADGSVRQRWRQVIGELAGLEPSGLMARRDELDRLLRNEGATYTVLNHAASRRRPWSLDPCPLVLDQAGWAALETAVAQRVRLLDLVLADIYGPRLLIERGLVPPELVLGSPAFLRPSDGISLPGAHQLFTTAVDVVRDAQGDFRAVGDRAQAPSGLGYALVNRSILSRVLPNLYLQAGVERLAGFFRSLRSGIAAVAPDGVDDPRVVILTPGPHTETYFEHAYLAAYLGYALVEGRDLEVRNNRVWLRSLAGLDPVDVVVRRVDDAWCDPVELRADSLLGVPGLMEVARRGRVSVINPVGVAVIESPAITGLLRTLAPALLGEELAIAGPETWWCGRDDGLSHVLAHLEDLVVLPAHPTAGGHPVLASTLSAEQLEALRNRIRQQPASWVGQEYLAPSTAPTVGASGALEPRPAVLRTFLVADEATGGGSGYGYTVLPGGLTRVGATPEATVVSSQGGGTSKDTWVASPEPSYQQSAWLQAVASASPPRLDLGSHTPLPSRVAAQLFMMGRTAEHAELVIRLIRTVLARLDQPLGGGGAGGAESLQVLVSALGTVSGFDPVSEADDDAPPDGGATGEEALGEIPTDRRAMALVLDSGVDGSLVSTLALLIDASYSVREQLSADTWQLIGDVEEELARLRNRPPAQLVGLQAGLQRLLQALLALAGLSAENMERDPVWLFLDAGRRLERAQSLVRLLRSVLVDQREGVVEDLLIESLLKTSESLIIFRRRTQSTMQVTGAVDLLVYDTRNPRSVMYQLERLLEHLADLPKQSSAQRMAAQEQLVLEATTVLRLTDADRLAEVDAGTGRRPELDSVLGQVDDTLVRLLDTLRRTYFAHERLSSLAEQSPSLELDPDGEVR